MNTVKNFANQTKIKGICTHISLYTLNSNVYKMCTNAFFQCVHIKTVHTSKS